MSPVRIAVIILAALVGSLGLALFARTLAAPPKKMTIVAPTVIEAPMTRVLVAGRDLQPGDRLTAGDFTWQAWPQSGLNPLYITDGAAAAPTKAPVTDKIATVAAIKARDTLSGGAEGGAAAFVGAIVREPMLRGEPLLASKVVKGTDAGILAVSLEPGMRAMAVPLSAESAAGGFILPGDHVDVVQSRKVDGLNGQQKFAAGSVLRNVKVMAIDQQTKGSVKNATPAQIGATATLEVTPEQAELLALSKSQGELTLILRPFSEIAGGPSAGGGPKVSQTTTVAPTVVKIFRNGAPADVMVSR
ncbi:MAG: Flp pilus assembly protein CpaB [Pseudomonadota bacterium]|nr:Flp pilus assembly protein CpaB [Pseudomonadota bacterium]